MFAQGKFPHCGERHPFTNPEETAQEHHHGNGAQHADAQLIAARGITLTEEIHHPRQANRNQKSRYAAENESPGLAGDHVIVAGGHGVDQRAVRYVDGGITD